METLDRCFENVCELDLIFHVDKVQVDISSFPGHMGRSLGMRLGGHLRN